jgi:FKBP-type peptidyl-prolyl cis-trans isomerase FklB
MQKSLNALVFPLLASGIMLFGFAQAQTPAGSSAQTSQPAAAPSGAQSTSSSGAAVKKPAAAAAVGPKTPKEKHSYALGMSIGESMSKQGLPVDPAMVARGLKDALNGKTAMTPDEMRAALQEFRADVEKEMQSKAQAAAGPNRKTGADFLAANKSKDGVKVLPDGLQYKVLTAGSGPKPSASDTVTVNYRGTLIDGTEFDSSYKRNQPASFPVQGVIKGWTEALQLMPVGSKWQLFIPADLAYGDRGQGTIPPGSTLIFEVELLSIGDQKK